MIKCPMCSATNEDDARKCRRCQADLALLADYVSHLVDGLSQAEALTRAGELGEAVWAYLAVLEIDPDNTTARRQVGKVVTAVRQFDETAPGRRWLTSIRKQSWWRRFFSGGEGDEGTGILGWTLVFFLLFGSIYFSYSWGYTNGMNDPRRMLTVEEQEEAEKKKREDEQKRKIEAEKKKKADEEKKMKEEKPLGGREK